MPDHSDPRRAAPRRRAGRAVLALLTASVAAILAPTGAAQSGGNATSGALTTTFGSNNRGAPGGAVYFDLHVAEDLWLTALDANFDAAADTPVGLDVYVRAGSAADFERDPTAWRYATREVEAAPAAGPDRPTRVELRRPLRLPAGRHALTLVARGAAHRYTDGNFANQEYADRHLRLVLGSATPEPFRSPLHYPKVWNGTVHYRTGDAPLAAFAGEPRSGPAPLVVRFEDLSRASGDAGIVARRWDFDGDGTTDATGAAPRFEFPGEGRYPVTLEVEDELGRIDRRTEVAYVEVGLCRADFTVDLLDRTSGRVRLTDRSAGDPTLIAWDFDGDGRLDAFGPSVELELGARTATVSLHVADAISSDTAVRPVRAGAIALPPASGISYSRDAPTGYWFRAPRAFTILGLELDDPLGFGRGAFAIYRLASPPPESSASAPAELLWSSFGGGTAVTLPDPLAVPEGALIGVLGALVDRTLLARADAPAPFATTIGGRSTTLFALTGREEWLPNRGRVEVRSDPGPLGVVTLETTAAVAVGFGHPGRVPAPEPAPSLTTSGVPRLGAQVQLLLEQPYETAVATLALGLARADRPAVFGRQWVEPPVVEFPIAGGAVLSPGVVPIPLRIPDEGVLIGRELVFQAVLGTPRGVRSTGGVSWTLAR